MFRYPLPIWATDIVDIADEDFTFQIGTCTKNNSLSAIEFAKLCNDTCDLAVLNLELSNHDLLNIEVLCILYGLFHQMLVFNFIRLATQRMHGRAFTHIKHTHLDSRSTVSYTHLDVYKRQLINSVNGEEESITQVMPLAKRYGAALLCLPLSSGDLPEKAEDRVALALSLIHI